jgi:predicted lipase
MGQFRSVTVPDNEEQNIGLTLKKLSEGSTPTRVLCCGHSLGGALATLAATWASFEYPEADVRCVTLGSPRVGNPAFVDACRCAATSALVER